MEQIRAIVGEVGLAADPTPYTLAGVTPQAAVAPATPAEAAALIVLAGEQGSSLVPWGGGTQMGLGFPPRRLDWVLSTHRLNHVVDYQPDDMTVTVEPGVSIASLQRLLAQRGQFLPLNPPQPERATVGGTVAAAVSGPWRAMYGTPRDWVIGCRVVGVDGKEVRGGGQVVKNVAGYDLPKLYTGSFGTLGLLTEVTFKVMPTPAALGVCSVTAESPEALEALLAGIVGSDLQPVSLEAQYAPEEKIWGVVVEFRNVPEAIEWQVGHLAEIASKLDLRTTRLPEEPAFGVLRAGVDRPLALPFLARFSTTSSQVSALAAQSVSLCERHGVPPLVWASAATGQVYVQAGEAPVAFVNDLRSAGAALGATCVFPRLPQSLVGVVDPWGPVGSELKLMQGLKSTLDPSGVFSPGRFVGGI